MRVHALSPTFINNTAIGVVVWCSLVCGGHAQTTHGLIAGSVLNILDGRPIPNATIQYTQLELPNRGSRTVSENGRFALPLLPPGTYRVRVEAEEFQAQELHQLRLSVAGTLELNFKLRPLKDVWENRERHNVFLSSNTVLVFFGPDVDMSRTASVDFNPGRSGVLESTLSQVVDPILIRQLPLAGRDVYAVLAIQPGVASDAATSRGLGLSVNGQRPTSTNYLLDGLENNNYLLSGPLTVVAPEAVQEYRVSTNNFSAEYGRTGGVVANAVTRSGGAEWHGIAYANVKNTNLNANDFQRNLNGLSRTPLKEYQPGIYAGGPLLSNRLFASAALEQVRFRSRASEQGYRLPSVEFLSQLKTDGVAAAMFRKYSPPYVAGGGRCVPGQDELGCTAVLNIARPSSLDQTLALARADYLLQQGVRRLMFRTLLSKVTRPEFSWSPYPDFISPLHQNATGIATSWLDTTRAGVTLEARLGWSADDLRFDRSNSQVPGLAGPSGMILPGSPLFYSYRNRTHNLESAGNLMLTKEKHILKMGGGLLARAIEGYQTTGREGYYTFSSLRQLAADQPGFVYIAVPRNGPAEIIPEYDREYGYNQWFAFFQGTWRVSRRFSLNYGVRYENFGAPTNVGPNKDVVTALGSGETVLAALRTATGFTMPGPGDQRLYDPDNRDWAGRLGFAYSLRETGWTVLRGAYGIFYDRPFDNLWQTIRNTAIQEGSVSLDGQSWNYLEWARAVPGALEDANRRNIFPTVTLFQPGLRTPYVQSYFVSLRQLLSQGLSLELSGMGSLGRKLITTDIVNRSAGRLTGSLPDVSYRANQGSSSYSAGAAVLAYRRRGYLGQATYTWSHAIDNQSDALAGEYGDLGFAGSGTISSTGQAAFSRQYDSRADRGNSSFDQRHSLVMLGVLDLPTPATDSKLGLLFRDWRASSIAAVRSGFPFTVLANPNTLDVRNPRIVNNRANVLNSTAVYTHSAAAGGEMVLTTAAFGQPRVGELGNAGRNAFRSPGFWNVDFSLSRSIKLPRLGDSATLVLRADVFNLLNHANLGVPDTQLGSRNFGLALYGRQGYSTGFPAVVPFRETARQIQLMLRLEF